jgi:hypothetical protein
LFQLLWGNNLLFDEKVTQPLRHTSISYPLIERCLAISPAFARSRHQFSLEKVEAFVLTQIVNAS